VFGEGPLRLQDDTREEAITQFVEDLRLAGRES